MERQKTTPKSHHITPFYANDHLHVSALSPAIKDKPRNPIYLNTLLMMARGSISIPGGNKGSWLYGLSACHGSNGSVMDESWSFCMFFEQK